MKFISISKLILAAVFPIILLLSALNIAAFSQSFYESRFSEYGIGEKINNPLTLHKKVIDFIKGASDELPKEFDQREKEHLLDVRNLENIFSAVLYIAIIIFISLLIASVIILRFNNRILGFLGKVMLLGGCLTVLLGIVIFALVSSDFAPSFEAFHQLLFKPGTYMFDPSTESLVVLYPEQIFMDIGFNISKWTMIMSVAAIVIGYYLVFSSKRK